MTNLVINAKLAAQKAHNMEVAEEEKLAQKSLIKERSKMQTFYKRTAKTKKAIEVFLETARQSGLIVSKPIETFCECEFLPANEILCCIITSISIDEEHLERETSYASYGYRWKVIEPIENKSIWIELYLTLDGLNHLKVSTTADEVDKKIYEWLVGVYKEALDQSIGKHDHHIHKDE